MTELASLDWLGDPAELKARARAELAGAGVTRPPDRLFGTDPTGAIRVDVDEHGQVTAVEIGWQWADRLDPVRLGPALLAAYRNARTTALAARVIRSILDDEPAEPAVPPPAPDPAPVDSAGRYDDLDGWLREVQHGIDRATAELAELERELPGGPPPPPPTEVASPGRLFRMVRQGPVIAGITADPTGVELVDPDQLGAEALGLFRAAALAADDAQVREGGGQHG
ncbi:MAG TPA: hypothetical protein VIL37_14280 [Natronosporangium sp.]